MGRIYKALILKNNGKQAEVVAFVDTGSDRTIISQRIADWLGVESFESADIFVADGGRISTGIGEVVVESHLDKIKCRIPVNITDIQFDADFEENIDMIIGVDFLQENGVKLDFGKGEMESD